MLTGQAAQKGLITLMFRMDSMPELGKNKSSGKS
jgi:hypothetical protein